MGVEPRRGTDSRVGGYVRKLCDVRRTQGEARALAGSTGVVREGRGRDGCSRAVDGGLSHDHRRRVVAKYPGRGAEGGGRGV